MITIGEGPTEQVVADRVAAARDAISAACAKAGREPAGIRIVAVTKGHSAGIVRAAIGAGLKDIGENRVHEALEKLVPGVRAQAGPHVRWHMVGHLQRNKVRDALGLFDWLQSLDSRRLARAISQRAANDSPPIQALVQVNPGGEDRKHGFDPGEAVEAALEIDELSGLEVRGVMAMAPWTTDERSVRDAFGIARRVYDELVRRMNGRPDTLSMGMSGDFEWAVEEGATMVRLGTALFGERER
jgi:pyridoxal phosphate enzyme (YggS family)